MPEPPQPVTPALYRAVLDRVGAGLAEGWRLMPIGGSAMAHHGFHEATSVTKDVDLVVLVLEADAPRVASWAETLALAHRVGLDVRPRKDQTSVACLVAVEGATVRLEFVRGRNPASGGYFVTRRVLAAVAARGRPMGRVVEPAPEGLAVLKAWAAVDQDKLVRAGKDARGFHAARAGGFRADVRAIRSLMLTRGRAPNASLLRDLLAACPAGRRAAIEGVLRDQGWGVAAASEPT